MLMAINPSLVNICHVLEKLNIIWVLKTCQAIVYFLNIHLLILL